MMNEDCGNAVGAMTIEHILRDADAVERGLGVRVVPAVDRDRGPGQTSVGTRHHREHMGADRLNLVTDRNGDLQVRLEAAPHVEPLRRAADEDRERLEGKLCLACRPGGIRCWRRPF
jgi:hypothetical protein